jgi:hypothetical protein
MVKKIADGASQEAKVRDVLLSGAAICLVADEKHVEMWKVLVGEVVAVTTTPWLAASERADSLSYWRDAVLVQRANITKEP